MGQSESRYGTQTFYLEVDEFAGSTSEILARLEMLKPRVEAIATENEMR